MIGLAAGTGIEAQRANDAGTQVAILSASLAAVRISATATIKGGASPTAAPLIDDGCDADPESVTGTTYTAFSRMDFPRQEAAECQMGRLTCVQYSGA